MRPALVPGGLDQRGLPVVGGETAFHADRVAPVGDLAVGADDADPDLARLAGRQRPRGPRHQYGVGRVDMEELVADGQLVGGLSPALPTRDLPGEPRAVLPDAERIVAMFETDGGDLIHGAAPRPGRRSGPRSASVCARR